MELETTDPLELYRGMVARGQIKPELEQIRALVQVSLVLGLLPAWAFPGPERSACTELRLTRSSLLQIRKLHEELLDYK